VRDVQLQIRYRLDGSADGIDFRKTLCEGRQLGIYGKRHPRQRLEAEIVDQV
jgi:hypothetical protein